MLIVVGKKRVCRLGDETEKERISNGKERQRRRTKERRGVNCVHKNVVAVDTLSTRAWTSLLLSSLGEQITIYTL